MKKLFVLASGLFLMLLYSCDTTDDQFDIIDYSNDDFWYSKGDSQKPVDVFYVYPSVSMSSFEENNFSWVADIRFDSVRKQANGNQRFNKMLYDDYNFYAPYYRQMIFDAYHHPMEVMGEGFQLASSDVKAAFEYYMNHFNNGRPFILMGHSQGSQMLIELLKVMTDKQFERMVAAYCIGFAISSEDVQNYPNRIIPATDSVGLGQVIVFNSVTDVDAACTFMKGNVVGINPLNWSVDTAFVSKDYHLGMAKYNDNRDSIYIVPNVTGGRLQNHMVVCSDLPDDFCYSETFAEDFPLGNLHFADSWLYAGNVRQNMECRTRHFLNR